MSKLERSHLPNNGQLDLIKVNHFQHFYLRRDAASVVIQLWQDRPVKMLAAAKPTLIFAAPLLEADLSATEACCALDAGEFLGSVLHPFAST